MSKRKASRASIATKQKATLTPPAILEPLSRTKRYVFTGVMMLLPIVLLAIIELGLRAFGYGDNLSLARKTEENGKAWWEINPNVAQRYFGLRPEFARQAEEARIAHEKSASGFRVICLGESSMAGFPYNKNATMPGILRTYLQQLFPERDIEVVNLGIAAVNSYAVRDLIGEVIALQPDVILIYAGHNEFYGALGVGSTFSLGGNRDFVNCYVRLLHYRSFYLLQEAIRKIAGLLKSRSEVQEEMDKPVMQQMARQQAISYGSALFLSAGEIFKKNLTDVVETCKALKIPVLIGTLVSNLRDQPPFISAPTVTMSREDHARWQKSFAAGLQLLQTGQAQAALNEFAIAAGIDSTDAEVAYYRGKSFLAAGDTVTAAYFFSQARDFDMLRFRAPRYFNVIIQELCRQHETPMVDVEAAFRERCRGGIIGGELIAEHLHPIVQGYALMAKTFLQALHHADLLPAQVDRQQIAVLPEVPLELNITALDEEIGRQRIRSLTSAWPFKQAVNLTVKMEAPVEPLVRDIAAQYIRRQIAWGEAHLQLAQKMTSLKQHHAALAEYQALHQQFPEEFSLLDNIGETLMSLQRYEDAHATFSQSSKRHVNSPFAAAGLGKACMFLAKYQEADESFTEAIKRDDRTRGFSASYRSVVFYLWGGALTNLRRYDQAEIKFLEALRLDPNNTLAKNFLTTLRAQVRKGKEK